MFSSGITWLKLGAAFSFAIALLHVVIIFLGAPAYRYFRAGEEMATMAEAGSLVPAVITFVIVLVFTFFGCYALSAASVIRRLPLLAPVLVIIGAIYTLRGMSAIVQIILLLGGATFIGMRDVVFSSVALFAGLLHLVGAKRNWKNLKAQPRS